MSDVVIAGVGQLPVGEHWEITLRNLGTQAAWAAIRDSGGLMPQAVYIGNALAPTLSRQANLGALLVDDAGLNGVEGVVLEAAGASGAAAARQAYLAVSSGMIDVAMVLGVEKFTDQTGSTVEAAAAQMLDSDYEAIHGLTPQSQAALLMQRYLHDYSAPREAFGCFAIQAHANAVNNPNAMYRRAIKLEDYRAADLIGDPLNMYDAAPYADGAAALIVARADRLPKDMPHPLVRISGSSTVIDTLALHDRQDALAWHAAAFSVERACRQAGIKPKDVDLFEYYDAYTIFAALSLEAAGFAKRGEGWRLAQAGETAQGGRLPAATMGGLKARGNPLGATGVYQLAEATLQLRGEAGACQVPNARRALVQSLGGPASTAVSHVLESWK